MKKLIYNRFFNSDEYPFELIVLNFVCILGMCAAFAAMLMRIIQKMPLINILTMSVIFFSVLVLFVMSAKQSKSIKEAMFYVVAVVNAVLFPVIFFTNGGADSGMAAYFTLGLMLEFLLIKGWK
ncbi:MAG: hypothetical protein FWE82_07045, partial [Defluviitaleaceae bacterium]|nr:hypothetical protein [Defluviitaleaceae bacterium]